MGHDKLRRFAELATFSNTIQLVNDYKGKWNTAFFKQAQPITLELGCGKGECLTELAQKYPHRNFIGVDIKGARLWSAAKACRRLQLENTGFLRIYIDHITEHFEENEVAEIWLTFPDPYLRKREERKRLTSPKFLERFQLILKNEGIIHFKTDSQDLFQYTLSVLKMRKAKILHVIEDLYQAEIEDDDLLIQTTFEKKHLKLGRTIKYLKFSL